MIEIMPPAVKTDLVHFPDDPDFEVISTDVAVDAVVKALAKGKLEIRPGQANQLRFMSRLAPGFIEGRLENGSKSLIPGA